MTRESSILYNNGAYWISRNSRGDWLVWRDGATHSTLAATFGHGLKNGYDRAKAEADKRKQQGETN